MISRLARGGVAAAFVVAALFTSGCTSTARDAATITYYDQDGQHTVHIEQSEFQDQLRVLGKNEAAVQYLTQGQGKAENTTDHSVDTSLASSWLGRLIAYQAGKIELDARGLQVTDEQKQAVREQLAGFQGKVADKLIGGDSIFGVLSGAASQQPPSDEEIKAFFDANKKALAKCNRSLYYLGFNDPAEAQSVKQQIEDMKGDLSKVWESAGAQRECVNLVPAELQAPLEDAKTSDVVIGPLSLGGAYFLLSQPADFDPTLDNMHDYLGVLLGDPQRTAVYRMSLMDVHVDPRYGTWDAAQSSVLAPTVPEPNSTREGTTGDVLLAGNGTLG